MGSVMDLTDLISEKIYNDNGDLVETGATKSIVDTLWDEWESFCKYDLGKGAGERFYGIPNYTPVGGITYDADLFEEKGYEVPETYDELIDLMDRMVSDDIIPFSWSSVHNYIFDGAMAFWANYEGKNDFLLNSTFKGVDETLGEINYENAWKLSGQEGRKAYLQFYYDLANNGNYTTLATKGNQSNLDAQNEYVTSILKEAEGKRIAMFIENSFWEREAYNTIVAMGSNPAYGWGKRNFKYMIAPVNKEVERKTVLLTYPASYTVINDHSDEKELACDFLKYVQSRKGLATYTVHTGVLRPYDFTVTNEEYQEATPFTRSLIDLTRRDDVDFVTLGAGNPVARAISSYSFEIEWGDRSMMSDGLLVANPYDTFKSAKYKNITVDDYFNGIAKNWTTNNKYNDIYKLVMGE